MMRQYKHEKNADNRNKIRSINMYPRTQYLNKLISKKITGGLRFYLHRDRTVSFRWGYFEIIIDSINN